MSNKLIEYKHDVPITGDTAWMDIIPPGYQLTDITFVNSTANVATIDAGITSGGNDIFKNEVIAANDITTVVISKTFNMLGRTSIFLNDDDVGSSWNSASLVAIATMKRVMI